jgi:CDP-glucose 4,6-dehydratase
LVINSYRQSFFNKENYPNHLKSIASARAGNVIGGGDWSKDRIIPDIVRALSKVESIIVRNPDAVRPWQHVLEPIGGYLHLGTKMADDPTKYADAWNFGPYIEDNLTVKDLVETAIVIWKSGTYHTPQYDKPLHEAKLLKLDINKTINELKWQPLWSANQAIQKTLEWYINSEKNKGALTHQQIEDYTRL